MKKCMVTNMDRRQRKTREAIFAAFAALMSKQFCHLLDSMGAEGRARRHIFDCEAPDSVFLHLFQHLQRNDNNILQLLSGQNNELFLQYFKSNLNLLIENQLPLFAARKSEKLPDSFWLAHIASTFVETVRWWIENGMEQSPETVTEYFFLAV